MTAVFERYCEPIRRFLSRGFTIESQGRPLRFDGLRHRHDLHDVLAETFRRAFEERARLAYSGIGPYEAYLKVIARNVVVDRLRSKRWEWTPLDEASTPSAAADHPSADAPDRALQQAELSQLIGSFLATLTSAERQFVELRYQQGRSQHDVAEALKKTRRWVRSTESRLRRRLVQQLRHSGYLPPAKGR